MVRFEASALSLLLRDGRLWVNGVVDRVRAVFILPVALVLLLYQDSVLSKEDDECEHGQPRSCE